MPKESDISNSYDLHVSRSSLTFPDRVRLSVNEFRFSRYTKGLKQFQDEIGDTPVYFDQLPEPAGTPDKPLNKEELFSQLSETLHLSGYTSEEIDKLRIVYEFSDNKFTTTPGRGKRKSGDDFITHSLWMAVFLAKNGITDIDVQMATILHDVHEDTDTSLEELAKISSPEASQLVYIVSKVKTERLFGDEISPQKIKEQDQKATQEKILDALEKDPRAFLIKAADVIHNQMTSSAVKDDTRVAKANLALSFYEKIIRKLGSITFADMIGDYGFQSVRIVDYEKIKALKEQSDEVKIPRLNRLVTKWLELESYDGQPLQADSISIKSPSIYQISQNEKVEQISEEHCAPYIDIVCTSESDLYGWHRFFETNYNSELINNYNTAINSLEPVEEIINLYENGNSSQVNISLATKDMLVKPAHLLIDAIKLSDQERTLASSELENIKDYYLSTLFEEHRVEQMIEASVRGVMTVYDAGGTPYQVVEGSTALDLAQRIGKNLGNDATNVTIYNLVNNEWIPEKNVGLNTVLLENQKAEFATQKGQLVNPNRYELVTTNKAITNIKEEIDNTLSLLGIPKDNIEKLYQGKEINSIYTDLEEILKELDPEREKKFGEFIYSTKERGAELIKELYNARRGKRLDSNINRVFEDDLVERFGELDAMYFNIGLTPQPFRDGEYLEKWLDKDNTQTEGIRLTNEVVDRLIKFRDTRVTMVINLTNQIGVIGEIGDLAEAKGLSIQSLRTQFENKPGIPESAIITVVFEDGTMEDISGIGAQLWDKYFKAGFKIGVGYSDYFDSEAETTQEE